ncbi:MAG: hypothetical protein KME26_21915 [Oscillatoria princeps RMCB-10]|nr:hypothetical protein [Oscillatoria princeps RMCB-10]
MPARKRNELPFYPHTEATLFATALEVNPLPPGAGGLQGASTNIENCSWTLGISQGLWLPPGAPLQLGCAIGAPHERGFHGDPAAVPQKKAGLWDCRERLSRI